VRQKEKYLPFDGSTLTPAAAVFAVNPGVFVESSVEEPFDGVSTLFDAVAGCPSTGGRGG
jgi:hypothetical protein